MATGFAGGFFDGLNEAHATADARSYAQQQQDQQQERAILMQLAQGDDDEIAALAGTGLLESLSGNQKLGKAKGISGYFGEARKSSHLPMIQAVLAQQRAQGGSVTPARPGGAALPSGSPVEPGGPQMRAPSAPNFTSAAPPSPSPQLSSVSQAGLGLPPAPPEMPPVAQAGLNVAQAAGAAGAPQGPGGAAAGAAGGMSPSVLGGMPPPPPPPELPQARTARLFPSANESAVRAKRAEVMASYTAMFDGLKLAQQAGPEAVKLFMGKNGSPSPQLRPTAYGVKFQHPITGEPTEGVGVLGDDGVMTVDGQPVQLLAQPTPLNQRPLAPRDVRVADLGPDGKPTGTYHIERSDPSGAGGTQRIETGMPVNTPMAPQFEPGAPIPQAGGGLALLKRGAPGAPVEKVIVGQAPPKAPRTGASPADKQGVAAAKGILAVVNEAQKAELAKRVPTYGNKKPKPLSIPELDALVKQHSKGQFQTYQDLTSATVGGKVGQGSVAPTLDTGFGSPAGANAIAEALKQRRSAPRQ